MRRRRFAADADGHTAAFEPVCLPCRFPQNGRSLVRLLSAFDTSASAERYKYPIILYDRTDWFNPIDQE
jgi:hypothetical protein